MENVTLIVMAWLLKGRSKEDSKLKRIKMVKTLRW